MKQESEVVRNNGVWICVLCVVLFGVNEEATADNTLLIAVDGFSSSDDAVEYSDNHSIFEKKISCRLSLDEDSVLLTVLSSHVVDESAIFGFNLPYRQVHLKDINFA